MHRRLTPSLLLTVLAACGSAPKPKPLTPPTLETGIRYFAGTVLSGRRPDIEAADRLSADQALDVHCDVTFVEYMPWDALESASARTSLIVSSHGTAPLLPAAELGIGARVGSGEPAAQFLEQVLNEENSGRTVPVFEFRGTANPGVTTAFYARSIDVQVSDDGEVVRKLVAIMVGREDGATTASIAMLFEDLAPTRRRLVDEEDALEDAPVVQRQLILLEDELEADGPPLAVVIPSTFEPGITRAFVARIELRRPESGDPRMADALAHCADDLRREGTRALADASWADEVERRNHTVSTSLEALDLARNHRPALAFLAGQGEATPLALDLALSGDDATLAAWASMVNEGSGDALARAGDLDATQVSWLLERSAIALLAQRLDRDDLSIELQGMFARHAGEAARFPGTITAMLARATDRISFDELLVAENLGFLDAPDPSARVRAFDWLANRGIAPEGYDPLGAREPRRAALDAFRDARREAAR